MILMTINGTAEQGQLAKEALCKNYNYQATIQDEEGNDIPNTKSDVNFAKRMVNEFIINNVKKYRTDQLEAQRKQAIIDADAEAVGITTE